MPQIYRQFGIEDTLFWRGVSDDMVKHTDYNWRGDDGGVVLLPKFFLVIILVEIYPKMIKQVMSFGKRCFEAGSRSATKHIYS